MTIKNTTKNTILSEDARYARTFIDKTIGLMFQANPQALLLNTRYGIHTFGMRAVIDVLVLDSNYRVVKLSENLKPNRLFHWSPKYDSLLELPYGTIAKSKTAIGDQLVIS